MTPLKWILVIYLVCLGVSYQIRKPPFMYAVNFKQMITD